MDEPATGRPEVQRSRTSRREFLSVATAGIAGVVMVGALPGTALAQDKAAGKKDSGQAEVISRVIGTQASMKALLGIAYIERLKATFRERLAPLARRRRRRAGAHKHCTLQAGMWLVGTTYNFVSSHCSLGKDATPAMAAALTDHRWSVEELLNYPVPPTELPKWRGRKPKWLLKAENAA